ncbi:hypothetical protein L873DRAFT_1310297 [Choiromyces venosus 120613-1]|uniref:Uncharacterized protein n=1 Tax=Choiromyces venosus 120613-1 TaxID=1336337 RepID=A0A3N4JBJ6_9PEZI|nr:hypothetical protein L873DRAFT_1310297 [Choiromyces venosus 120613-1]
MKNNERRYSVKTICKYTKNQTCHSLISASLTLFNPNGFGSLWIIGITTKVLKRKESFINIKDIACSKSIKRMKETITWKKSLSRSSNWICLAVSAVES